MITGHSFPPLSLVRSRLARHNLVWSTMMSDIRKRTTNHKKHQETNSADTGVSEIQTISRYLKFLQLSIYLGNGTLTLFWPLLPWNGPWTPWTPWTGPGTCASRPLQTRAASPRLGLKWTCSFNMLQYASICFNTENQQGGAELKTENSETCIWITSNWERWGQRWSFHHAIQGSGYLDRPTLKLVLLVQTFNTWHSMA